MNHASELEAIRADLSTLTRKLEATRAQHEVGDEPIDRDWEEMLRRHDKIRATLRASDGMTRLVIESLRLDVDTLRHSLRRWLWRNDHRTHRTKAH